MGWTKMTNRWIWVVNSTQFKKLKFCLICLFCVAQNKKNFELKFCTLVYLDIIYFLDFFFSIFGNEKVPILNFSKNELHVARVSYALFDETVPFLYGISICRTFRKLLLRSNVVQIGRAHV